MRNVNLTAPLSLTAIRIATVVPAQDLLRGTLTMGLGDVASIKPPTRHPAPFPAEFK